MATVLRRLPSACAMASRIEASTDVSGKVGGQPRWAQHQICLGNIWMAQQRLHRVLVPVPVDHQLRCHSVISVQNELLVRAQRCSEIARHLINLTTTNSVS
jgi:hypothetical protein